MNSTIADKISFIREQEFKNTKRVTYQKNQNAELFENPDTKVYLKKQLGIDKEYLQLTSALLKSLNYNGLLEEKFGCSNNTNLATFLIPNTTTTVELNKNYAPTVYETEKEITFTTCAFPCTTLTGRLKGEYALASKLVKSTFCEGINSVSRSIILHSPKEKENVELHYYIRRKNPYFLPPTIFEESSKQDFFQTSFGSNPRADIWSMNISFWFQNYPKEDIEYQIIDFFANTPVNQQTKENFIGYMNNFELPFKSEIYDCKVALKELRCRL